jgi:serine/threonine protein kinase
VFSTYFADARPLGSGSYGAVYDARYTLNDVRYAVKLLTRRHAGDNETENEVLRVSFLQDKPHPNCLAYYFAWSDKRFDEYGIVSEMCAEGSLKRLMGCSPLTEEQVWDFFVDLLHGLDHIHKNNLRHFDIKPENLFVTKDHVLRIGDFGVACPVGR